MIYVCLQNDFIQRIFSGAFSFNDQFYNSRKIPIGNDKLMYVSLLYVSNGESDGQYEICSTFGFVLDFPR